MTYSRFPATMAGASAAWARLEAARRQLAAAEAALLSQQQVARNADEPLAADSNGEAAVESMLASAEAAVAEAVRAAIAAAAGGGPAELPADQVRQLTRLVYIHCVSAHGTSRCFRLPASQGLTATEVRRYGRQMILREIGRPGTPLRSPSPTRYATGPDLK